MGRRRFYWAAAGVIFAIEMLIALFVRDAFVRPYLGDVLAVMLVYCALRAVFPVGLWTALAATLAIAFAIEFAQLWGLLSALGLEGNRVARVVLGGSFDRWDFVAYSAGCAGIAGFEFWRARRAA